MKNHQRLRGLIEPYSNLLVEVGEAQTEALAQGFWLPTKEASVKGFKIAHYLYDHFQVNLNFQSPGMDFIHHIVSRHDHSLLVFHEDLFDVTLYFYNNPESKTTVRSATLKHDFSRYLQELNCPHADWVHIQLNPACRKHRQQLLDKMDRDFLATMPKTLAPAKLLNPLLLEITNAPYQRDYLERLHQALSLWGIDSETLETINVTELSARLHQLPTKDFGLRDLKTLCIDLPRIFGLDLSWPLDLSNLHQTETRFIEASTKEIKFLEELAPNWSLAPFNPKN